MSDHIEVYGAKAHNLRNVDVKIPRNSLVVITGLSGSGKSSLAFNTIYAEGQRRYMETFSSYARQFLGTMERPEVDKIEGLSPVISIEQKTTSRNPRSTVGTVTELSDFLRLLFARASTAFSYNSGEPMVSYTDAQIVELIGERFVNKRVAVLAPVVRARKGHYRELFDSLARQGFSKVRVNRVVMDLSPGMKVDRYKTHDIELVIDRLTVKEDPEFLKRLDESMATAMHYGQDILMVLDIEENAVRYFSRNLMCPSSGISYPAPEPNTFSFNSPKGMCPVCKGLGVQHKLNLKKLIPDDRLSIAKGGLAPLGTKKKNWTYKQIETIATCFNFSLTDPISSIPKEAMEVLLKGSQSKFDIPSKTLGITRTYKIDFEGFENYIESTYQEAATASLKRWAGEFMDSYRCTSCEGSRLKKEALHFKILNATIADSVTIDLKDLHQWIVELPKHLSKNQKTIAS